MSARSIQNAITLAGALAEAGVQQVEFRAPGATWQTLNARATDLPGLIASAPDGTELRWPGGGAARIDNGTLKWSGLSGAGGTGGTGGTGGGVG